MYVLGMHGSMYLCTYMYVLKLRHKSMSLCMYDTCLNADIHICCMHINVSV